MRQSEQLSKGSEVNTAVFGDSLHCPSLSGASLAIGEQANIVSVEYTDHQRLNFLEYFLCRRNVSKAVISNARSTLTNGSVEDLIKIVLLVLDQDAVLNGEAVELISIGEHKKRRHTKHNLFRHGSAPRW